MINSNKCSKKSGLLKKVKFELEPRATIVQTVLIPNYKYRCDIIHPLVRYHGRSRRSPVPLSGPLGGPSGPLGGPSGPLDGPSGPLVGPSGPLGGPSGPLGGPSGPLGGPSGPLGVSSGSLGGSDGRPNN